MAGTDQVTRAPVIQSVTYNNGRAVILPVWVRGEENYGNLVIPNPHANSSTGDVGQQYPLGTKFIDGDRTFHYGYTQTVYTGNKANLGMFNFAESASGTGAVTWGATAGAAGDTKVGIIASGLTDTTPAEDDFAGGWLLPRTNPYSSYRIIASSVSGATTSGEVDLYLDHGLVEAVSASQGSCYVNFSPWSNMAQHWAGGIDYASVLGVTLIDPIASTWQWVQTWGPCYVVPYNEEIGATSGCHDCFFHIDGTIKVETRASGALHTFAGTMLNSSGTATTSTWLIKLKLDP